MLRREDGARDGWELEIADEDEGVEAARRDGAESFAAGGGRCARGDVHHQRVDGDADDQGRGDCKRPKRAEQQPRRHGAEAGVGESEVDDVEAEIAHNVDPA